MTAIKYTSNMTLQAFFGAVLAFIAWWGFDNYAPSIEGALFPVAVSTTVDVKWIDNQTVELSGDMNKIRDCQFERLRAEAYDRDGRAVTANLRILEPTKIRPPGTEEWGPWIVGVPVFQTEMRLRLRVRHECHAIYDTSTTFFDGLIVR